MKELWEDLATTEMRLHLMSELLNIKVGLADIEEFNLGLKGNLRNKISTKFCEMQESKIVKAAMKVKMHDEQITRRNLMKSRNKARATVSKMMGKNSKRYRTTIRKFRDAAMARKAEHREKYTSKLRDLKFKYREDAQEKLDKIPDEMQDYLTLSIFDREKFDRLKELTYEITCLGNIELSNEEKSILRLHPKFSIEFEQELSNTKLRIQLNKELEKEESEEKETETPRSEEQEEEDEAKSRLTFDPITKTYNDGKRKVTDLEECSRITLPTKHETIIEMRRGIHSNIYKEYRKEKCNKHGEQASNLTEEQQQGLKSLQLRIKNKEIVILKTDKSGKLFVATTEEYIKMGHKHTKKDKIIYRR